MSPPMRMSAVITVMTGILPHFIFIIIAIMMVIATITANIAIQIVKKVELVIF